jgi:integrase
MAIGKPRGKEGMRPVYVYDPAAKRKVYVGQAAALKDARKLFRDKTAEFAKPRQAAQTTCTVYAERWLEVKHGPNTRRPARTTWQVNKNLLKPFLGEFGDRPLTSIGRGEALDWSAAHSRQAKAVAAMFNDAFDDELVAANPFANRRQKEERGRRDIAPLREDEIEKLCELAPVVHGLYGQMVAGWIAFLAWTGCRPSEAWKAEWADLDFDAGRFVVHRVKGKKQTQEIVLPQAARTALEAIPERWPRTGTLFRTTYGKQYTKGNAGYYWREVKAAFVAQLDEERRAELLEVDGALDPYALRHFCGSLMADRGLTEFDIAHQLGHSPEVCRKHYIHAHRDRTNDRVEMVLDKPQLVDLNRERERRVG